MNSIRVCEAPDSYLPVEGRERTLFLAGGITNCPDWQTECVEELRKLDNLELTVFNPRRKNFPINDPKASYAQIEWEHDRLELSEYILFWFAKGSLNPIVLYELGRWGNSAQKYIWVGCDPEYTRSKDVEIQTQLSRPEILVYNDFQEFVEGFIRYFRGLK